MEEYNKICYEDVKKIFENHRVFSRGNANTELYWYEYMWSVLGRKSLTIFHTQEEKYNIYLRAVALIQIFFDYLKSACEDENYLDYVYVEDLIDKIDKSYLDKLIEKYPYINDFVEDYDMDYDKVVVYLAAELFRDEVYSALCDELGKDNLFYSMGAVVYLINAENNYFNDKDILQPNSSEEFWEIYEKIKDQIVFQSNTSFVGSFDKWNDEEWLL